MATKLYFAAGVNIFNDLIDLYYINLSETMNILRKR